MDSTITSKKKKKIMSRQFASTIIIKITIIINNTKIQIHNFKNNFIILKTKI